MLFHLNHSPEILGAAIVRRIASDTLAADEASPLALARLCFVLGHLALKLLVYSEASRKSDFVFCRFCRFCGI